MCRTVPDLDLTRYVLCDMILSLWAAVIDSAPFYCQVNEYLYFVSPNRIWKGSAKATLLYFYACWQTDRAVKLVWKKRKS